MLTPGELQQKILKSGLDFRNRDIKTFVKELQDEYESLYKKQKESQDKIEALTKSVRYYKSIEKTLQNALILAEKVSDEKIEEANDKTRNIRKEAQAEVDKILLGARGELLDIHDKTIRMQKEYERYRKQYVSLVKDQLDQLNDNTVNIDDSKWKDLLNETKKSIEDQRKREIEEDRQFASEEKKRKSASKKMVKDVKNGKGFDNFLGGMIKKYDIESEIENAVEDEMEEEFNLDIYDDEGDLEEISKSKKKSSDQDDDFHSSKKLDDYDDYDDYDEESQDDFKEKSSKESKSEEKTEEEELLDFMANEQDDYDKNLYTGKDDYEYSNTAYNTSYGSETANTKKSRFGRKKATRTTSSSYNSGYYDSQYDSNQYQSTDNTATSYSSNTSNKNSYGEQGYSDYQKQYNTSTDNVSYSSKGQKPSFDHQSQTGETKVRGRQYSSYYRRGDRR